VDTGTAKAQAADGAILISETDVSRRIREALETAGYKAIRLQSGRVRLSSGRFMHLCPAGTPDLLVLPMRAFVEVKKSDMEKTRKNTTAKRQAEFRAYCERNDIPHLTTSSAAEALAFIRSLDA
jgi:hypothetical protein